MTPTINSSHYSVVIVGAMNPAIHHPQWYSAVEMLSADEAREALRGGAVVLMPQLAQFQAAGLQIQCTPANWQINTADEKQRDRILDIAAKTFVRLGETPIGSYGINARFDVNTGSEQAVNTMGSRLCKQPVDLSFEGLDPNFDSLAVSYSMSNIEVDGQPQVQRQLKMTIARAIRQPDAILLTFNMHHSIVPRSEYSRFDLDVLLRESAVAFAKEKALMKHITDGLTDLKG